MIHEMLIGRHTGLSPALIVRVWDFPDKPGLSSANMLDRGKDEP
jgi:hypothetical protein